MADTTRRPFVDNTIKPLEPNPKHASFIIFEPVMYDPRDEETIQGFGKTLQIPVMPESLTITQDANHNEEQSLMIGGVLERNAPTLRQFSIDTFLPRSLIMGKDWGGRMFYNTAPLGEHGETGLEWKFIQKRFIDYIQFLMKRRMILDYTMILTPTDRHRQENFYVCIKHFEYTFNPHDDLDYRLDLIEWREPKIRLTREETTDEGTPDTPSKPPRTPSRGDGKVLLVMHDWHWRSGIPELLLQDTAQSGAIAKVVYDKRGVGWGSASQMPFDSLLIKAIEEAVKWSHVDNTKYANIPLTHNYKGNGLSSTAYKKGAFNAFKSWASGFHPSYTISSGNVTTGGGSPKDALDYATNKAEKGYSASFTTGVVKRYMDDARAYLKNHLQTPNVIKYYDGGNLIGLNTTQGADGNWTTTIDKGSPDTTLNLLANGEAENMIGKVRPDSSPLYRATYKSNTTSQLHNTMTTQTGKLPYDDLVKRIQLMDVPIYQLCVRVKKIENSVVKDVDAQRFAGFSDVSCELFLEQIGTEKWSLIETVGTRYHRGQRFAVPDAALRSPTKEEVAFDKTRNKLNNAVGRK